MQKLDEFKKEALERCNYQLQLLNESAQWNNFEEIDVIDKSYYDVYDQEAWDIYVFNNCGIPQEKSIFSKCQLSLKAVSEDSQNFGIAQELFHVIMEIRREFELLQSNPELTYSEGSQEDAIF